MEIDLANSFPGGGRVLRLSNGGTDVFLSVLQFALSDLAESAWERALAQWVALHDDHMLGRGMVGFGLEEISWDRTDFLVQKSFVLRAIDAAITRYRWDELCYDPPHAGDYLNTYREMVEQLTWSDAPRPSWSVRWPGPGDLETICPVHTIHCSLLGRCRVCVDCADDLREL